MALESVYSTVITNRDATPKVLSNANISKGILLEAVATVEAAAAASSASKYYFFSLPSNARVSQVLLSCDDHGSTGTMDVGIYQTTENGSAVVDLDLFADAQVLTTALANSDITHESAQMNIAEVEKPLWELLGLSADPKRDYDVVGTLAEASELGGTISLKARYVI